MSADQEPGPPGRYELELLPQTDGAFHLRLHSLDASTRGRGAKRIRTVAFCLGATVLGAAVVLAVTPLGSTAMTAELVASAVQFSAAGEEDQPLLANLPVASAIVSRAGAVVPAGISGWTPQVSSGGKQPSYVVSLAALPGGSIRIASLPLPAGSTARIVTSAEPNSLRIEILCSRACSGRELALNLHGQDSVHGTGMSPLRVSLTESRPVIFRFGDGGIDLDVVVPAGEAAFLAPIRIDSLALRRRDVFGTAGDATERVVSSILSGTLRFLSYAGRQHQLHRGERVEMALASGNLDHLALGATGLEVIGTGRFSSVHTGPSWARRSLIPTWLEHLHEKLGFRLVVVTVIAAFPVVFGAVRWWLHEGE